MHNVRDLYIFLKTRQFRDCTDMILACSQVPDISNICKLLCIIQIVLSIGKSNIVLYSENIVNICPNMHFY